MKQIVRSSILLVLLLLVHCAKQGFPPGGPEDRTPPEIVKTEPAQGQTRIPPGNVVRIWFSERIRNSTLTDAVYFSPNPGDGVKFSLSGRKLVIRFPKPFHEHSTTVVTLGTGIQDLQGNALKSSYTLAFTGGDSLDQGRIRGRAYGAGPALGLDVWAYALSGGSDPDPRRMQPDYAVQCREDGTFLFSHLSPGKYRVFAVRDRARDRLYLPVEDEIGVPPRDMILSADSRYADSTFFRMTREDTLGPSLIRTFAPGRNRIYLLFDKTVETRDMLPKALRGESGDSTRVRAVYTDPSNPKQICLLTESRNIPDRYPLSLRGLADQAGNPVDSSSMTIRVESTNQPDTTSPKWVSMEPKQNDRSVNVDAQIRLVFSEPMDSARSKTAFVLTDDSGQAVPCRIEWESPASLRMIPNILLAGRHRYQFNIRGAVMDFTGLAIKDTTVHFRTLNEDTLSEISGNVADLDQSGSGPIEVFIRPIDGPGPLRLRKLPDPGIYRIERILPGKYLLECYRDSNGNGQYDFGKAFPFKPSERFAVYPDTVVVRSRWPNEGNHMVLP